MRGFVPLAYDREPRPTTVITDHGPGILSQAGEAWARRPSPARP